MAAYRHVIFDIDGTLLDSEGVFVKGLIRVGEEFTGHPISPESAHRAFSRPSDEAMLSIGIAPEDVARAIERYDEYSFQADPIFPFPGVTAMLEELDRRRIPMAIFTARCEYEFTIDAAYQPLARYFHLIMGTDYAPVKPAPDGLLRYMREAGVRREEILFVGDSAVDCGAAAAAGVDFGFAGWNPAVDRNRGACRYFFTSPSEVLALVDAGDARG